MKHRTDKKLTPLDATKKKMRPISRASFSAILAKSIKMPSEKPAAK